jgi:hypothetical protein
MKSYHKLYYYNHDVIGKKCWAFDKLDGQNMRFEGNLKRGFYKFGSRNQMLSTNDVQFGIAHNLFMDKYHDELLTILSRTIKDKNSKLTVFAELVGPNSFCGKHHPDDKLDLILFDIWIFKNGWIHPEKLLDDFGHLGIPEVIYKGELDYDFISSVKENKFTLKEGVIAKGQINSKDIFMVKIKTRDWLEKVKNNLGEKYLLEDMDYNKNIIESYKV